MLILFSLACLSSGDVEDLDRDGWPAGQDCDDQHPGVRPDAVEICNGVDDDCDGLIDEEAVGRALFYRDQDGDGYGDVGAKVLACGLEEGLALSSRDCDDRCATCAPGMPEVCDGRDNDCDGLVDEEDAGGALAWYEDADGDDFGDVSAVRWLCAAEAGVLEDASDCDDSDDTVYPGAQDWCGDEVDGDCDGRLEDCLVLSEAVDGVVHGLAPGDGLGAAVMGVGDLDGDGFDDLAVGAPGQDAGGWSSGAVYLLSGPVTGTVAIGSADGSWAGELDHHHAGVALAGAGDVDGDGLSEFFVGASHADGEVAGGGAVYLVGSAAGAADLGDARAILHGNVQGAHAGLALAAGHDFDGDGIADLAVGAPRDGRGGVDAGAVSVVLGPFSGRATLDSAAVSWLGEGEDHLAGTSVQFLGDSDGDGLPELVIGAPGADGEVSRAGVAYVISWGELGEQGLGLATGRIEGLVEGDRTGQAVAGPGDIDGDGFDDLAVGAWLASAEGRVGAGQTWLLLGPLEGTRGVDHNAAALQGGEPHAFSGYALAAVGDVDGSGSPDLLVGAWLDPELSLGAGMASLALDPGSGMSTLGQTGPTVLGDSAGSLGGVSVAPLGDTDGDGLPDIVIGASGAPSGVGTGEATVLLGRSSW